jgi:hypothetical protein
MYFRDAFLASSTTSGTLCSFFALFTIHHLRTIDKIIKERCTQSRKAICVVNSVLWDQGISEDNKKRIYNTIIKSIVTYSSEIWPLKKKSGSMRLTTETDF